MSKAPRCIRQRPFAIAGWRHEPPSRRLAPQRGFAFARFRPARADYLWSRCRVESSRAIQLTVTAAQSAARIKSDKISKGIPTLSESRPASILAQEGLSGCGATTTVEHQSLPEENGRSSQRKTSGSGLITSGVEPNEIERTRSAKQKSGSNPRTPAMTQDRHRACAARDGASKANARVRPR